MKKSLSLSVVITFAAATVVAVSFQNCAPAAPGFTVMNSEIDPLASLDDQGPMAPNLPDHDGNLDGHQFAQRKAQTTIYNTQVMNRHQIFSTLQFIFGPTIGDVLSIESTLSSSYAWFGGPCSVYDSVFSISAGKVVRDLSEIRRCNSTMLMNTPAHPPMGSTRLALMDKICGRAVQTMGPVSHALQRADTRVNSVYLPPLDDYADGKGGVVTARNHSLYLVFRLFYPTQPDPREIDPGLLDSMRLFFENPAKPTLEEWQEVLYTLCISPYWQVL